LEVKNLKGQESMKNLARAILLWTLAMTAIGCQAEDLEDEEMICVPSNDPHAPKLFINSVEYRPVIRKNDRPGLVRMIPRY
jgi:hypothetical protein